MLHIKKKSDFPIFSSTFILNGVVSFSALEQISGVASDTMLDSLISDTMGEYKFLFIFAFPCSTESFSEILFSHLLSLKLAAEIFFSQ